MRVSRKEKKRKSTFTLTDFCERAKNRSLERSKRADAFLPTLPFPLPIHYTQLLIPSILDPPLYSVVQKNLACLNFLPSSHQPT